MHPHPEARNSETPAAAGEARCPFGHGAAPEPAAPEAAPPEPAPAAGCPFGHGANAAGAAAASAPPATAPPRVEGKIYRLPQGPAPVALFGFRGNVVKYFRDPVPYLKDLRSRFGNVASIVGGGNDQVIYTPIEGGVRQTVFGFGAEVNREVVTQPEVFGGGLFRAPPDALWINGSMSSVEGQRRIEQKAILSPAFVRDHLKNYYLEMAEEIDRMLDGWESRERVDFVHESYELAARIASRCFYGQEPGLIGGLAPTLRDFAHAQMNPLSSIRLKIPGTPYWHLARLAPQIRRILGEELRRKEELGYPGNDVLSMMMRAQHDSKVRLSEDEVLGNALGLYLAGHDVPANGLIFLVALLATHPEASERLMEEIDREIGDRQISYEQIFKLPELGRVWQEMLRVLSPALLIFRQAKVDTTLGDCEIGRGTEVLLSPYMTNTDPATYADPLRFAPERWKSIKPSNYEFLPFGFGPRRCLGASFAEIQLKLAITKIFQRYRLTPGAGARMDFKYTIAIQPKGPTYFEVRPQDRRFAESRRPIAGDFSRFVESAPRA